MRAPLQRGDEKEKGLVLRVRGYIRMEMSISSISGGVCGEELDESCSHLQSRKKRN